MAYFCRHRILNWSIFWEFSLYSSRRNASAIVRVRYVLFCVWILECLVQNLPYMRYVLMLGIHDRLILENDYLIWNALSIGSTHTHPIMSCRNSRKKLEEELMGVNNQIAELNSEAKETAVQQLEEEIRVCKNMINCTVCSNRPKEVKTGQLV